MPKVGRNDPCLCGSGKKYKFCCLGKKISHPRQISGVVVDPEDKQIVFATDDMLINQFRRDGPKIEASFDQLCSTDLRELGGVLSRTAAITLAGLRHATRQNDELRTACAELLVNALNNVAAAVQVLRSGFVLAPGVLARNVVETIAVIAHVYVNPADLAACRRGTFPSTRAIASAKKVIPAFGHLYGFLSENYTHIGRFHHSIQPIQAYAEMIPPLQLNLAFLRATAWLMYVMTELVFLSHVASPRYWSYKGKGIFMFALSDTEREWLKAFLKQAYSEDIEATPNKQVNTDAAPASGAAPVT